MSALAISFTLAIFGQQPTAADPAKLLADPIVDGSYGFSIRPPKDWQIVRRRLPERRGVTLLQMVQQLSPAETEEIILKQTATTRAIPMDEMLKGVAAALELEFSSVQVESQQVQQIAGKSGGLLSATFLREGGKKIRLEAIIEVRPQSYLVLIYNGPARVRSTSEPLFNLVLGSLQLLTDAFTEEQMKLALTAGQDWLASLRPDRLTGSLVPGQFLQFELNGKVIGGVAVWQTEKSWEGRPGVEIRERGWTFDDNGQARRLQNNMFVSKDLRHERWKSSVTTLLPAVGDRPAYLDVALEEGLRAEDVLLTNQTYQLNQPAAENPAIHLPPTYIPRALIRLLPLIIADREKQRMLAFVTFDHSRAGLITRVIELKGKAQPPDGVTSGMVYLIDDREGLSASPSHLYVDNAGRTLLVKAGDLTMRPTTEKQLEATFGPRIEKAEKQMNELERAYAESEKRFGRQRQP